MITKDFEITYVRGDTYSFLCVVHNLTEDLTAAFFTVKENPDDDPVLQKTLGEGITKVEERDGAKVYKVQIQATDTERMVPGNEYLYDLQLNVNNVKKTVAKGIFKLQQDITQDYDEDGTKERLGVPIDVTTAKEMSEMLTAENVGKAYRYTGETTTDYTKGDIYIVEYTGT